MCSYSEHHQSGKGYYKMKMTHVQRLLQEQPLCIFCGGENPSETEDHVPPRTLFWNKKWPDGYSFGACAACNHGSSDDDYLIGALAKMGPDVEGIDRRAEIQSLINKFLEKKPKLAKAMRPTAAARKRLAKEYGIHPEKGGVYNQLTILELPTDFDKSMEVFASKVTKALHFKHTKIIVPKDAAILFIWNTNANVMKGQYLIDQEITQELFSAPSLKREAINLNNQFHYQYQLSPDDDVSLFYCQFGLSMSFLTFVFFDSSLADDMRSQVKARAPGNELHMRFINGKNKGSE